MTDNYRPVPESNSLENDDVERLDSDTENKLSFRKQYS